MSDVFGTDPDSTVDEDDESTEGTNENVETSRDDVVAVDEDGNEYIEAPEGGLFGDDAETNFSRVLQPDEQLKRDDGLVGVDPDYPQQASRSGEDTDDSDES